MAFTMWVTILLTAAFVIALAVALRLWRTLAEASDDGGGDGEDVPLYLTAALAGGMARVASTAMLSLVEQGVCRLDRHSRRISAVEAAGCRHKGDLALHISERVRWRKQFGILRTVTCNAAQSRRRSCGS